MDEESKNPSQKNKIGQHERNISNASIVPIGLRQKTAYYLAQTKFHVVIIAMVMSDLIIVMIELVISQYVSSSKCSGHMKHETIEFLEIIEDILGYISFSILCLFVLEVFIRIWATGIIKFFTCVFSVIDFVVIVGSFVLEIIFDYVKPHGISGDQSKVLILLRMLRIIRMLHAVAHGIEMMAHKKIEKIKEAKIEAEDEVMTLKEKVEILTLKLEEERFRLQTKTRL